MNYEIKYLKYKNKYLTLKNQHAGSVLTKGYFAGNYFFFYNCKENCETKRYQQKVSLVGIIEEVEKSGGWAYSFNTNTLTKTDYYQNISNIKKKIESQKTMIKERTAENVKTQYEIKKINADNQKIFKELQSSFDKCQQWEINETQLEEKKNVYTEKVTKLQQEYDEKNTLIDNLTTELTKLTSELEKAQAIKTIRVTTKLNLGDRCGKQNMLDLMKLIPDTTINTGVCATIGVLNSTINIILNFKPSEEQPPSDP